MKTKSELVLALIELIRNADCIQFDDSPILTEWVTIESRCLDLDQSDQIVLEATWGDKAQFRSSIDVWMLTEAMSNKKHAEKLVFANDNGMADSSLRFFKLTPIQLNSQSISDVSDSLVNTCVEQALDDPMC